MAARTSSLERLKSSAYPTDRTSAVRLRIKYLQHRETIHRTYSRASSRDRVHKQTECRVFSLLVQSIQIENANLSKKITGLHAGQNLARFTACWKRHDKVKHTGVTLIFLMFYFFSCPPFGLDFPRRKRSPFAFWVEGIGIKTLGHSFPYFR